jgi:hypothetical protein
VFSRFRLILKLCLAGLILLVAYKIFVAHH